MRIFIVSVYPFPVGFSATNRIISYAKGLVESGHFVKYFCLRPTEQPEKTVNVNFQGSYQGIEYLYTGGTTIWSRYLIFKILQALYGYLKAFVLLTAERFNNNFDSLIISSDNVYLIFPLSFYVKTILRKKAVLIVDEFPHILRENNRIYRIFPFLLNLEQKLGYNYFDGIITMTRSLHDYFMGLKSKACKMKVIPMTVEPERFDIKIDTSKKDKYIAYIGDLVKDKDGVDYAISAFASISNKYPGYKFLIIGAAKNNEDFLRLKELVFSYNLQERIIFTGKVNRDDVPKYLCNAELLVLARPDNERAKGGFPTKLGEYLATGNPVVVTKVGEIPEYLTDGVNAFISNSNDPVEFAVKINEALSDFERAKSIGKKGKELAFGVFNYKIQAANMAGFLNEL